MVGAQQGCDLSHPDNAQQTIKYDRVTERQSDRVTEGWRDFGTLITRILLISTDWLSGDSFGKGCPQTVPGGKFIRRISSKVGQWRRIGTEWHRLAVWRQLLGE
ncbi:MAG: hypothetical protein R6V52_09085 [Bacteroidales bacterium]